MPVLEEDGFSLWESNAIVQYLATKKPEMGLPPKDERARADVSRWMFWESAHWDPACAILVWERLVKGMFGRGAPDPVEVEKGLAQFHRNAKVLDEHLKGRKFLCGDRLTIADFSVGAVMIMAERAQFPLEDYPQIRRWYASLAALPAWQRHARRFRGDASGSLVKGLRHRIGRRRLYDAEALAAQKVSVGGGGNRHATRFLTSGWLLIV